MATSEKLWPGACSILGGPRSSSAQKPAKKCSIAARPSGVRRSPRAASRAVLSDGQRMAGVVKAGAQPRQALVAHQHQEALFRTDRRARPGRSRKGRSRWHRAGRPARSATAKLRRGRGLGRKPFHRIAVDGWRWLLGLASPASCRKPPPAQAESRKSAVRPLPAATDASQLGAIARLAVDASGWPEIPMTMLLRCRRADGAGRGS